MGTAVTMSAAAIVGGRLLRQEMGQDKPGGLGLAVFVSKGEKMEILTGDEGIAGRRGK